MATTLRSWLILLILPVVISVVVYRLDTFTPAPFPVELQPSGPPISVPERNGRILGALDKVGEGLLLGPEDLAYDAGAGAIFAACSDGWIKRVSGGRMEAVENWAFVGGRPLGIAFAPDGSLIVAESKKGLMRVRRDGSMDLLAEEAEGLRFGLIDGVDVASDGTIYFTDASSKYDLASHLLDIMEGRPHGRLLQFDPTTNTTIVLLRDLYFANGVALAPDQKSVIVCETPVRRCLRYHLSVESKGKTDVFIENIPGFPDNIRYDGEGRYWIGIAAGRSFAWDLVLKHPFLRKLLVVVSKFVNLPLTQKDGGVLSVSLEGKLLSIYSDPGLHSVTGGLKVGTHLYFGFLHETYVGKLDLVRNAAKPIN